MHPLIITSATIEETLVTLMVNSLMPLTVRRRHGESGVHQEARFRLSDSDVLFGPEVKVTVTVGVPAVTTGLSVTPGTSSLALSWTAPAENGGAITGYDVHYTSSTTVDADADASGNDPSAAWVAASHSGTTASGSITGLSANTTYRVRVRAKNEHGSGAWSAPQSGTTPPPTPVVEFQHSGTVEVVEGLNTSVSLSVNPAPSSSITVAVGHTAGTATTGNTCAADADYVRPPASVTVAAGATSQNIPLSLCADALVENNETFTLTLNAGTGYTVGATSTTTVTIRDATLTVSLSASPNPVNEGTSVTVTAMRSGQGPAVTIPVTVTAVTAESGDYGTLTGIPLTAGATTGTATITTAKDADANDETFTVALNTATLPLPHAAGTSSSVTITITDPDLPDIPVRLSVSPNPVQAGGTVTVTATLSSAARSHVSIPITLSPGTAQAGDYGSLSSISIANGATKGTGTIPTTEDADTSNETFTVALGNSLPSGITAGSPSSVEVTIQNRPNLTASLSAAPNPVQEGGAVTITVALSETQTNPVTIPLTVTPGTAESGDFDDASPVNVTITAGQTEAEYRITTYEDGDSHDETFTVALDAANLPTEVGVGSPRSVDVTITDPDVPNVSLSVDQTSVEEGEAVTVTIELSEALNSSVTIPLILTSGTAESGDYDSTSPVNIDLPAGQTEAEHTINTYEDDDIENESFTVAIDEDNLPSGIILGSTASATITITDPDTLPEVSLSADRTSVEEGEAVTVTIGLSEAQTGSVTIPLILTAGTAESGDYDRTSPVNIDLPAGQTEAQHTINTYEDDDIENESFTVAIDEDNLPDGIILGSTASATITITDPDTLPEVSLSADQTSIEEGEAVTVTVGLSEAQTGSVTIPLILTAGTAESERL